MKLAAGAPLPPGQLVRRQSLPLKPAAVTLAGRHVLLRPLDVDRDAPPLHAVSNGDPLTWGTRPLAAYDPDALVWRYMSGGPFASVDDLAAWLRPIAEGPTSRALCAVDQATGRPAGIINLINNSPADLKVELGSIWYSPAVQRTLVNTEATFLLLAHAFAIGYRRVEWKCDTLNERSRRTALRLGFTFEGIQEYHYIVKGRSRDTAWYRMLDWEWAATKQRLIALLEREG